jgi:hypothetical protein
VFEYLTLDETFKVKIGEKEFEYTKSDKIRCIMAIYAMVKGSGARSKKVLPPRNKKKLTIFDFWTGFEKMEIYDDAMINNVHGIICGDFCGKCLHQCPANEF